MPRQWIRGHAASLMTLGAVMTLTVMVVIAGNTLAGLDAKVGSALQSHHRNAMQSISQDAINSDGKTATITTVRGSDETVDKWLARHLAAVAAFEAS